MNGHLALSALYTGQGNRKVKRRCIYRFIKGNQKSTPNQTTTKHLWFERSWVSLLHLDFNSDFDPQKKLMPCVKEP